MSVAASPPSATQVIPVLLKGQKALVTGANSGIGRAIAIALGQSGADVAVNYVDGDAAAQEVVDAIIEMCIRDRSWQPRAIADNAHRRTLSFEVDVERS